MTRRCITTPGTDVAPPRLPLPERTTRHRGVRIGPLCLLLRTEIGGKDPKPHCLGVFPENLAREKAEKDMHAVTESSHTPMVADGICLSAWDEDHKHGFEWNVEPLVKTTRRRPCAGSDECRY